jgi:hypothetical protein
MYILAGCFLFLAVAGYIVQREYCDADKGEEKGENDSANNSQLEESLLDDGEKGEENSP